MLEKISCHRIITQPSPLISEVQSELGSRGFSLQVDELLPLPLIFPRFAPAGSDVNVNVEVEPYPASTEPYKPEDLVMYMHSSGSTGYPKPIPFNQRLTLQWGNNSALNYLSWIFSR